MRDIERPATRTSDDDLADLQACAQEVRDAFAGEDTDQDNQGLREAANGVLDHYFHRRAKSLLQDRTLEAAMQRLYRAVAASSRDMSPVVRDTEQEPEP
jgi:DNA-binding GntR family transcriptional regulator